MSKRTKYIVQYEFQTARFSNYRHALLFAEMISLEVPWYLVEVRANDGIVGQYQTGKPTPEFVQHHLDGIFHSWR